MQCGPLDPSGEPVMDKFETLSHDEVDFKPVKCLRDKLGGVGSKLMLSVQSLPSEASASVLLPTCTFHLICTCTFCQCTIALQKQGIHRLQGGNDWTPHTHFAIGKKVFTIAFLNQWPLTRESTSTHKSEMKRSTNCKCHTKCMDSTRCLSLKASNNSTFQCLNNVCNQTEVNSFINVHGGHKLI